MTDSILKLTNILHSKNYNYKTPSNGDCSMVINKHKVNLRDVILSKYGKGEGHEAYRCTLRKASQKIKFYILYIKNNFYILPAKKFPRTTICISPGNLDRHYAHYKNNWGLLG
jgi:hypothetical protein